MTFAWTTSTVPFSDGRGRQPARFLLEQVGDDRFRLLAPVRYHPPAGDPIDITPDGLGETDLASIQASLSWFVNRHGRHTPAALLHDQLVGTSATPAERRDADRHFRQAMSQLGVPPVRGAVMWSAVTLASRWDAGGRSRLGIALWGAASLAGTAALVHGIVRRRRRQVLIALVAPAVAAPLWGRQAVAGVVGGYAVWLVVVPTASSLAGYGAYWVLEESVRAGRWLVARRGAPAPPGAVPYTATT